MRRVRPPRSPYRSLARIAAQTAKGIKAENHRERVLSNDEEQYLKAATAVGEGIREAYLRALGGIRATMRGQAPLQPDDPLRLRDVAIVLIDSAIRPDECFRLRWETSATVRFMCRAARLRMLTG
jgi:hypothetical protein